MVLKVSCSEVSRFPPGVSAKFTVKGNHLPRSALIYLVANTQLRKVRGANRGPDLRPSHLAVVMEDRIMKRLGGIAFGLAFAIAAFSAAPAAAGPFGATASIREMSTAPIVDVQVRRARPVGRAGRPVARGRGRGNGAAVAAGLIGAAIIGGAIIANSQPRRRYHDDSYYYDGGDPYYGSTGYVVQQPQPYYGGARYYQQPQTNYGGGQIIYTPDKETPYTYAPAAPRYQAAPRRHRQVRDPAGGGSMR